MEITLGIKNQSKHPLPTYAKPGDSGFDIRANIDSPITLYPNSRVLVPTGLFFNIPEGHEIQIRSRSGLSAKDGIIVLNAPGTIDCTYIGELRLIMINLSAITFIIEDGMRLAQAVVCPVPKVNIVEISELSETERGTGGFGHTGIF